MKVELTKELKVEMLKALRQGYADTDDFKELHPPQVVIFELPDNGRDKRNNSDIQHKDTSQ